MKLSRLLFTMLLFSPTQDQAQLAIETLGCELSTSIPGAYSVVFADEFEGTDLDKTKWEHRYPDRQYLAGYNSREAITQPGDGSLHLSTSYRNDTYYTGMLQSVDRFLYGYFEACVQFQSLQGHHGAFWLQSPLYGQFLDDPGRSGAEIDVIEFFGNGRGQHDAEHNVYWNAYGSSDLENRSHEISYFQDFGTELSDSFHIFGLLWRPDEYVFFVDGTETWRASEGVSHTEEYLVLSLVTAAWENSRLNTDLLPNEMLVDYVRVYAP